MINCDLGFDKYFRLIKAIVNLVYTDLIYLSKNVENEIRREHSIKRTKEILERQVLEMAMGEDVNEMF